MATFHHTTEEQKTFNDSDLPEKEGVSEKWLLEKIDNLIPLIQEKWPSIAQQTPLLTISRSPIPTVERSSSKVQADNLTITQ